MTRPMFQHPARRPSARPLSAPRGAVSPRDDDARCRPVCGLFPAYPSPNVEAAPQAASPRASSDALVHTPATAARAERARRSLQNVVYIEAPFRASKHHVRELPVFSPPQSFAPPGFAPPRAHVPSPRVLSRTTGSRRAHGSASRWAEEPVVVGLGLLLCFPVGVALLWASPRFTRDARLALTAFTGFVLALAALVVIARG